MFADADSAIASAAAAEAAARTAMLAAVLAFLLAFATLVFGYLKDRLQLHFRVKELERELEKSNARIAELEGKP